MLNNSDKLFCEGALNRKECLDALKSMKGDKSSGTDGLPCEFYKVFWNDLVEILLSSLNYSYDIGKLSISQRRGIIKLIPKKDAELNLIKNWWPLTLLNCDYKIATKAIASRMKVVIPTLISDDQTGFIKGRFIGDNIRLIDSFILYILQREICRDYFSSSILRKPLIHLNGLLYKKLSFISVLAHYSTG